MTPVPKRDWLYRHRIEVGACVVAMEAFFFFSHSSAFVYPPLLVLHWLLARRHGMLGRAFWALLGGLTSFIATWWYLVFATREHHELVYPNVRWLVAGLIVLSIWGMPNRRGVAFPLPPSHH